MNTMRFALPAVAALALIAPPAAHAGSTSTVNDAGYIMANGNRGVVKLADAGAAAKVPGGDVPLVVSLGDSYISGEAGRWAGNVSDTRSARRVDALKDAAYSDVNGKEAIDGCHRARQAEVNFSAPDAISVNLACSGAITTSVLGKSFWKPGIDNAVQKLKDGSTAYGQTQLLANLAAANKGRVQMVILSIGGNDFDFGPIVAACATAFLSGGTPCSKDPAVISKVSEPNITTQRTNIANAIDRVLMAVGSNGAPNWTLLVQDYPSPIATSDTIRYKEDINRWYFGGCPMLNDDLDWANQKALNTIDDTVKDAVALQRKAHTGARIEFLELRPTLVGHRLCENNLFPLDFPFSPVKNWDASGAVDNSEWVQAIRIAGMVSESLIYPFTFQEALHPNYWAQLAYQNCLSQAYGNGSEIKGGTCVQSGKGLDKNKRPRMALLGNTSMPGKVAGKVRQLRVVNHKRTATVSWSAPRKAADAHYAYRLRSGKHWSGWIGLGISRSVVVAKAEKGRYRVQVATESGSKHGPAAVVRFAGR